MSVAVVQMVNIYQPQQPDKGRRKSIFDDDKIARVLRQIQNKQEPEVSRYHLVHVFMNTLGLLDGTFKKTGVGKGRKALIFSVSEKGIEFLENFDEERKISNE